MKKLASVVIWVDNLSLFSFAAILRIVYRSEGVIIRYLKTNSMAYKVIHRIKRLNIFPFEIERCLYSMGDIGIGRESIGMKFQFLLPEVSHKILEKIRERSIYKKLIALLPEERVNIYFEQIISNEVFPLVRLLSLSMWYKENEDKHKQQSIIFYPKISLIPIIKQIWQFDDTLLTYKRIDVRLLKKYVKHLFTTSIAMRKDMPLKESVAEHKCMIGVRYTDGVDLKRGSDIFWHPESKIDPQNLLIYFDIDPSYRGFVIEDVCGQIEKMGFKWISLLKKSIFTQKAYVWKIASVISDNQISKKMFYLLTGIRRKLDVWIFAIAGILMLNIEEYVKFFKTFNIKIITDRGAQTLETIEQSIAFDLVKGIRIGFQRSTVVMYECLPYLMYNCNHIYFIWGEEAKKHKRTSKAINNLIVSGYTVDAIFQENMKSATESNEKFKISLFDNVYSDTLYLSKKKMVTFYLKFLEWLLEDEDIIIVIKEKKPVYFEQLIEIQDLVSRAIKTGRFIRLGNALGRLPSDASKGADMSVGIGVSSAIIEAVIGGCRGIHCDLAGHYAHPYYKWGYGKIIFDDIDAMITAIKRYKENPESEKGLGDWSEYLDQLDSFRDGRGGERIGTYMRWLLEAFDNEKGRDEAIQYANELYANQWGEDKVIDMSKHENS